MQASQEEMRVAVGESFGGGRMGLLGVARFFWGPGPRFGLVLAVLLALAGGPAGAAESDSTPTPRQARPDQAAADEPSPEEATASKAPGNKATTDERIAALEEQVQVLAAELSAERVAVAVPEDSEFDPVWGVGPSAAKVYGQDSGLSIGGYGEVRFQHDPKSDDIFDARKGKFF